MITPEYKNPIVKNTYFANIPISSLAVNQKFYFKDLPQLRSAWIYGIETQVSSDLAVCPDGSSVVSTGTGINFTLIEKGTRKEFIRQTPLLSYNRAHNNGRLFTFIPRQIDWQSAGITLTDITGLTVGQSVAFTIYYSEQEPMKRPSNKR
jgi:hypothetical protein